MKEADNDADRDRKTIAMLQPTTLKYREILPSPMKPLKPRPNKSRFLAFSTLIVVMAIIS